jgi:hypothetical protein
LAPIDFERSAVQKSFVVTTKIETQYLRRMAHRLVIIMTEQNRFFKYFTTKAAKIEYGKAIVIFVCYFMQQMLVIQ